MLRTLYWLFLAAVILLLAYSSLFSIIPLVFLSGGLLLGFSYLTFLYVRRRRTGVWEHSRYQFRFAGSVFVYITLYWTTVGMFSNVKELREFTARYEPYVRDGAAQGYTFHYVGHPECYERINSPELNRFLEENHPEEVRLVLEVVKDFGRLRAYSVARVDSIPVNSAWIGGTPPWDVLRAPK